MIHKIQIGLFVFLFDASPIPQRQQTGNRSTAATIIANEEKTPR